MCSICAEMNTKTFSPTLTLPGFSTSFKISCLNIRLKKFFCLMFASPSFGSYSCLLCSSVTSLFTVFSGVVRISKHESTQSVTNSSLPLARLEIILHNMQSTYCYGPDNGMGVFPSNRLPSES